MAAAPAIRPVELDDIENAVALLAAQLIEHDIATPRDALRAVVTQVASDPYHGFMLLALAEDRAVGIAYAAAHLSAEHGGTIGWLEELYVIPEMRSRGIGSALLSEVVARAQARCWRGLELEIVEGHERAVALYQRYAFRPLSRTRFSLLIHS